MGYIGNNPKTGYTSSEIDNKIDSLSQNGSPLDSRYYTEPEVDSAVASVDLSTKQDALVSGTNIKTVNGESVLGVGDIPIAGVVADYQEFTTSGTWTKPDGCNYVYVEAWGAGQAGSTDINGTGGFFSNALLTASDVSTSVTVTIGAGGTSSAEIGGNSKFGNLVCGFGSGAASSNVSSNNVMNGGTGGGIKYFRDGTSETPTSQKSSSKMLLGGGLGDGTGYGNTYYTLINPQFLHIDTRNSFIYGGYMYTPVFGGWYLIKTEIDNINIVLDTIYLGIQGIGYMGYNYKVINSDLFIFRSYSSAANTGANLSYYKADLSTISSGSITLETKLFTNTHSGYVPQTASIELYNGWYYIVCANMKDTTFVPHYVIFKTQDFTNYTLVKVATSTTNTGVILGDIGSNTNGIYFTYTLNATTLGTNTVFQCVTSDATATTWTNLSTSIAGNRPSKFIVRDNGEIVFACLYYSSGWKMRFCIINSSLTTVTNIQYASPVSYNSECLSITKLDNGEIHACTINGNQATIGTSIFKLLISNTIATYFFHTSTFDFQFPIYGNTTSIKGIFRTMSSTNPYLATYKVQTITDSGSAYNEPPNIGFDYTAIPRSKKIAPFFTGGGDGGIAAGGGRGSETTSSYYVKFQDNPANIAKGGDGLVRVWCW